MTIIPPASFIPKLESAEGFIGPGHTAPRLKPLPASPPTAQGLHRPENLWAHYWALEKQPLRVRAYTNGWRLPGCHHLDAVLGSCQLHVLECVWPRQDHTPRVIPLPLDLLGIVKVPKGNGKPGGHRLPVWASTPFEHREKGVYEALCIGNFRKVEQLLSELIRLGDVYIEWEIVPLELSREQARLLIGEKRPMPGQAQHFTPPYHWNWLP